jgi:hypothetical protein
LSKLIVLVVHRVKLIEVSLSIAQLLATLQYARAGGFPTYSPRGEILATRLLDQKKRVKLVMIPVSNSNWHSCGLMAFAGVAF